jgi:hypothetical protein
VESDAQTVAAFGQEAGEGFEDAQQSVFRSADARVVHFDLISRPLRRQPIKTHLPDSVYLMALVTRIRQHTTEQDRITYDMGIR